MTEIRRNSLGEVLGPRPYDPRSYDEKNAPKVTTHIRTEAPGPSMRRYVVSWRRPNWSVFGRVVFAATPEALAAFVRAQAGDEAALVVEHERDAMPGEYERWLALRLWTEDWTRLARTAEARTLL